MQKKTESVNETQQFLFISGGFVITRESWKAEEQDYETKGKFGYFCGLKTANNDHFVLADLIYVVYMKDMFPQIGLRHLKEKSGKTQQPIEKGAIIEEQLLFSYFTTENFTKRQL